MNSISGVLSKWKGHYLLFILAFAGLLLISLTHTQRLGYYHYRSSLWGDKAGYYIYLPAALIYKMDASSVDPGQREKFGNGFQLEDDKFITKYTLGPALLSLPLFILLHTLILLLGKTADGFHPLYFYLPALSASIYASLGMYWLSQVLAKFARKAIAWLVPPLLFLSTHLLYYTVQEGFMSHVFSFAMFSLFLFSLEKSSLKEFQGKKNLIGLGFSLGMILLIRPSNLFIVILLLAWNLSAEKGIGKALTERIRILIQPRVFMVVGISAFLVLIPQMLYWKYAYGSFIAYSYGEEGFHYLLSPRLPELLFAPRNGLLLYTPIFVLLFIFMGWMALKPGRFAPEFRTIMLVVALSVYLMASWWDPGYGCSFSSRPFVEYTALLAIPAGAALERLWGSAWNQKRKFRPGLPVLAVIVFFLYSLQHSLGVARVFDGCFYGQTWQWNSFRLYLDRANVFPWARDAYTIDIDFEHENTIFQLNRNRIKTPEARSGHYVSETGPGQEASGGFRARMIDLSLKPLTSLEVSLYVRPGESPERVYLVCQAGQNGVLSLNHTHDITHELQSPDVWTYIQHTFDLPDQNLHTELDVFVFTPSGDHLMTDDLRVRIRHNW